MALFPKKDVDYEKEVVEPFETIINKANNELNDILDKYQINFHFESDTLEARYVKPEFDLPLLFIKKELRKRFVATEYLYEYLIFNNHFVMNPKKKEFGFIDVTPDLKIVPCIFHYSDLIGINRRGQFNKEYGSGFGSFNLKIKSDTCPVFTFDCRSGEAYDTIRSYLETIVENK